MLFQQNKWLVLLFLNLIVIPVYAANQSQIINIKADYLLLDEQKGISKYKGHVLFKKDTLIIKADTVTLYYDGSELTKALITGSPADIRHRPDNEAAVHSQANKIIYLVAEERLLLSGQAFVDQGERHFSGESIEYDTRQRIITASGKAKSSTSEKVKNTPPTGRVHVIIGPNDNAEETEKTKEEPDIQ